MNLKFFRGFFAALFLIAAPSAFAQTASVGPIAPQAEQFVLKNGLQVVVIPDHRAPVVTHMVWYKVGAADEVRGNSGLAHFLEHLMFKGTQKNPSGKFSKWLSTIGGQENAFTSSDYTAFFQRTTKNFLPQLMDFEADRMTGLVLNEANVLPERDVIIEERRQTTDQRPEAQLGEAMQAALFQNHPYGNPVIGWMHEMQQLTPRQALDFYAHYYTPNNAILIVAGDVTTDEARKLAEQTYGKIMPRSQLGARKRPVEPISYVARSVSLANANVQQVLWSRIYLVPSSSSVKNKEAPALQVLAEILGGTTGRLYQKLAVEKGIAAAANADYDGQGLDSGRFSINATPKTAADFPAVEKEIDAILGDVAANGISAEEMERARASLLAATIYAEDNQMYLARLFGAGLTTGMSFDDIRGWPQRIAVVTLNDVQAAAKAWLRKERSVTGSLTQREENKSEPEAKTGVAP